MIRFTCLLDFCSAHHGTLSDPGSFVRWNRRVQLPGALQLARRAPRCSTLRGVLAWQEATWGETLSVAGKGDMDLLKMLFLIYFFNFVSCDSIGPRCFFLPRADPMGLQGDEGRAWNRHWPVHAPDQIRSPEAFHVSCRCGFHGSSRTATSHQWSSCHFAVRCEISGAWGGVGELGPLTSCSPWLHQIWKAESLADDRCMSREPRDRHLDWEPAVTAATSASPVWNRLSHPARMWPWPICQRCIFFGRCLDRSPWRSLEGPLNNSPQLRFTQLEVSDTEKLT